MKANELRIGNKVQDNNGFVFDVVSIHDDGTVYCDFKENEGDVWEFDKNNPCVGIELTEEILLKCPDIENRNTNPKSYYLHNRIIFIDDNGCYDYATRVKLPYLHTFQNFIYALTNEELTIKL